MAVPHDPAQELSLKERARLALTANPQGSEEERPAPRSRELAGARPEGSYTELVELRLQAIQQVREMAPRRACYGEWIHDLEQSLSQIPRHSVHYRPTVQRLLEAHEEWLELEERLRAAHEVIRSTQWLVNLLTEPSVASASTQSKEVASAYEGT